METQDNNRINAIRTLSWFLLVQELMPSPSGRVHALCGR